MTKTFKLQRCFSQSVGRLVTNRPLRCVKWFYIEIRGNAFKNINVKYLTISMMRRRETGHLPFNQIYPMFSCRIDAHAKTRWSVTERVMDVSCKNNLHEYVLTGAIGSRHDIICEKYDNCNPHIVCWFISKPVMISIFVEVEIIGLFVQSLAYILPFSLVHFLGSCMAHDTF